MNFVEWSKSNVEYGQKLVSSALEGAREGEYEFLKEEALAPYLGGSARQAFVPGIIGAYLGVFGASVGSRRRTTSRTVALGLLGGAVGFGLGLLWENRDLGATIASSSWDRINKVRDEHWFEKNPIDYA